MGKTLETISNGVIQGDQNLVREQVRGALEKEIAPETILKQALIPAMSEVGRLFEDGEYFVPEMLVAARAMKTGLEILKPRLVDSNVPSSGKVVIGTVKGDLHDIGKNLVGMMLEGAGFEVVDLGTDVSPARFVGATKAGDVDIVAMSALLTTTMRQMETTINALKEAGLRDHVKIIVGGAPVTQTYAEKIGADGFAPDASQATRLAQKLVA